MPLADAVAKQLRATYDEWRISTAVLADVVVDIGSDDVDANRIEAALENVLMSRLLVAGPRPTARALFDAVDNGNIDAGADAVGLAAERLPAFRESITKAIGRAVASIDQSPTTATPTITVTGAELVAGDFRLALDSPVERLLRVARERAEDEDEALARVAICALRYRATFARTRHIGPPQEVYDYFFDLGVRNEAFASPFNARVLGKPGARFCSAFADTDGWFGSMGSFFEAVKAADKADAPPFDGAWSLDPPFLEATMSETMDIISRWRTNKDAASMVLIVPSTFDKSVSNADEKVQLEAGKHHYEGLDGTTKPLPVDVSIHRFGDMDGFEAKRVIDGYTV